MDTKEGWAPKNWCFWVVVLEKTLESPLVCKETKPGQPVYSTEGLMLKLKHQYFGHLMWRAGSLEKTLLLGKTESKRRRGQQRMRLLENITNSKDMNLRKFREIVKDREAWQAAVHGVSKSQIWLGNWTITTEWSSGLTFTWTQSARWSSWPPANRMEEI